MIVLHYRAIPDLREQVRRATNPAADQSTDTTTMCIEPDALRTAEPEPVRTAEPDSAAMAGLVRTAA